MPGVFLPIIEKMKYKMVFDYLVMEKAFERISHAEPDIRAESAISYSININPTTFKDEQRFLA